MSSDREKPGVFYVTTPIYYVNDRPHLGHVYTTLVADVAARFHRLRGDDVFFLTGVDEHAAKVSDRAAENGMGPQAWADRNALAFRETFDKLRLTFDDFVRTSSDRHKERVTAYVTELLASGDVYEGRYEGWYDAGQEEYVPENKAEAQGFRSEVNGKPLVKKSETNYFFRLSAYRERVLAHIEAHPGFVQPAARRNEVVNRIKEAQDVPISRTGAALGADGRRWGIPVPGDAEQTIYVWIDALFNYLTYADDEHRRRYWQAGATHYIAKDILWFHAAIWPALLLALRERPGYGWVNLPQTVFTHSYWVSDSGEKMSKSLGNFLDPEAIDRAVEAYGIDALRYFLATKGPLGTTDASFSAELFDTVYHSDLANTFGNSASRVTNMLVRYCGGAVPCAADRGGGLAEEADRAVAAATAAYDAGDLEGAAEAALTLVRRVDAYVEATQPFKMWKAEELKAEVGPILARCVEALRVASVLLWPITPHKVEDFWSRIGCGAQAEALADGGRGDLAAWAAWGGLAAGMAVQKGEALFPRVEPAPV
ncbi:methionine--tRNA ligase [Phycisphaera mikurensis]|uniref:Methionine--tRNA ligase n=1 Tax=Phycisphaera mikurensis (strain NBRC 102666 / KCTC 22515 / FYK2301M01) TaxID=1142394 RepID=I0IEJ3_PHYMF|nr:methionine--tRNA ligase [Phycisphaera mikurensis]MBB6441480.1 methionyl-tRNA synthetase [Phycisphaera mikurensis]BAM03681.1 methionyl-tRNA synthetase [Phycisphaera mikurensis NBRC 102666]